MQIHTHSSTVYLPEADAHYCSCGAYCHAPEQPGVPRHWTAPRPTSASLDIDDDRTPYVRYWDVYRQAWGETTSYYAVDPRVLAALSQIEREAMDQYLAHA